MGLGQKGASPPNCCCLCLFFRGAARCPALEREELGALRRRAGLPRSPLQGSLHAASDIPGSVEQPAGLRGNLDSNGDGSAEPGNLLPHLPQRPPAHSDSHLLHQPDLVFQPAVRGGISFQEALQVDEGGVIGIAGVRPTSWSARNLLQLF